MSGLSTGGNGVDWRNLGYFFVLFPLALGALLGLARIGAMQFQGVGYHVLYVTLQFMLSWACWGVGCKLVSIMLRPWRPPLLLVLTAGQLAGGFVFWAPLRHLLNAPFVQFLAPGSSFPDFWPPANPVSYVAFTLQGTLFWIAANSVHYYWFGVPRFGFAAPGAGQRRTSAPPVEAPATTETPAKAPAHALAADGAESSITPESLPPAAAPAPNGDARSYAEAGPLPPRLASRLPARLRGADILALEAEEHYTKIHSSLGSALLLLRFSDAIREMEPKPGLRVHRSFWVSRDAVERVEQADRRWVVVLSNGLKVPVSRSYRVIVESAGLDTGGD